jgi:radical SAM protein with 4Fe4S-binding SPASM domain
MRNPLIRPFNAAAAGFSCMNGNILRRTNVHGMPVALGIELTNHCNLKCPECNSGSGLMTRTRGFISTGLFEKIIAEAGPYLYNLNLYFQGESMMHPQFFSILEKCSNIYTTLSTNGHFLSEENAEKITASPLRKLIVSLDGMDKQAYNYYRVNGDLDKVLAGIRYISESVKRNHSDLKLVIQFLVYRKNEQQLNEAKIFAGSVGASFQVKSMQIINKDSYETWLPSQGKFSRYVKEGSGYAIKNRLQNRCVRLWFNPVITWDGKVLPCCFDKNADHVMGDMNQDSLRNIWIGEKYMKFRKDLLTGRRKIEICRNCTSGIQERVPIPS